MDPYIWQIPTLVVVGVVAGFLNVLAGGGSLLTLPLLIFFGLPVATANGTNRIAIFCQNIFAITGFKRQGIFPIRLALICTPPALIGSYIGANMAITVDEMLFRRLLAIVMIGVLIFMIIDPLKRLQIAEMPMTPIRLVVLIVSFFGIGIYGGFVQAGVGFIIITGLLVHGLDLVRINAVKVLVIFAFTIVALGVFVVHGQVDYVLGFALATGNSLGGWFGSHMAVKKGHEWIKRFVIVTVAILALRLLFP
ncbi:MAG: sulfite exporter TauE/SafE family protein [Deltaproteobacteria bacterium]|nr:MAG: sulfite exporter TauE/SafE family protein [Deltaproteobacteria bacterium]